MLLTYSIRPLTLQELAEGMVVDQEAQSFDPGEHRLTNYRHALEICSSLVSVSIIADSSENPEPRWLTKKKRIENNHGYPESRSHKPVEVVQFSHFSVKEYMVLERAKPNPKISRFGFSPAAAHRCIVEASLIYLLDFGGGERLTEIDCFAFPFLTYAAQSWPEHWQRQLLIKNQETVNGLLQRLFDPGEDHSAYINYINICRPDILVGSTHRYLLPISRRARSLDSIPQPLYYTSQIGHLQLCEWLIDERRCNVNSICKGEFGQAIHVAARFGHKNVVEMLLDRGAELDRVCGRYANPLQAAAYGGHVDIIGLLLDRGADPNAAGGDYGSALIAACDRGHLAAARVLLDRGADMNVIVQYKGEALSAAAKAGNKALVQLLLSKGADINDPCGGGGGALYWASAKHNLDMVKFLVASGANVNLRSEPHGNALQAAFMNYNPFEDVESFRKHGVDIARFLLQHGADVNMYGGWYGDTLQAAIEGRAWRYVEGNNTDMVKLLVDYGADINHRGGASGSPMLASVRCGNISAAHLLIDLGVELDDEVFLQAVWYGLETVIPRLLAKGLDVNAQNQSGTVLQLAIRNGDEVTAQALLNHPEVDINALGDTYKGVTAVYLAVKNNNKEITKKLLDMGADVNLLNDVSKCIAAAARYGDQEMVKLLLDSGADINAHPPNKNTALMAACFREDIELIEFLLANGAHVNIWVQDKGDALQRAALKGNEAIVELLLAHGADVKAPEGTSGSCLECAIQSKNKSLIRKLIDAGTYVNFSRPLKDLEEKRLGYGGALSGFIINNYNDFTKPFIQRGADVNRPGNRSYGTPLMEAIQAGNEIAMELLLENGADVNQVGGEYGSALACSIAAKDDRGSRQRCIQKLLQAGADVSLQAGVSYGCPLGVAIHAGDIKTVEKLLDLGADINAPAGKSGSLLRLAIFEDDLDIFRLLLSRGADPNLTLGDKESPLGTAAGGSERTMLKELLEHGADPNIRGSEALSSAAAEGDNEGILLLIEHGANIHTQEGVPGRALQLAAINGQIDTVRLLLDKGVDVNAFGGDYGNALLGILADPYPSLNSRQFGPITQILLDAGINVNSPPSEKVTSALQAAIMCEEYAFATRLLDLGADINAHHARFGTALSAAAYRGNVEFMMKLVERGADFTLGSQKYGAPLQVAARSRHLDAVKYLLSLGADANEPSGKHGYALHAACAEVSRDIHLQGAIILKALVNHGADPNARGGKYETALQAASRHGYLEKVKYLISVGADPTIEGGKYGSPLKAALAKEKHYHVANFLKRQLASRQTSS